MRLEFDITVSGGAHDLFFNAAGGYRAQYLRSPLDGVEANRMILAALLDPLLRAAAQSSDIEVNEVKNRRKSLTASSSKIWIHEDEMDFNSPTKDLDVASWVAASAANPGCKRALWGLHAPIGTRLIVMGAFMGSDGGELIAAHKILRHEQIHRWGFS